MHRGLRSSQEISSVTAAYWPPLASVMEKTAKSQFGYTFLIYLFHSLKSLKQKHLFYLYLYMSSEHTLSFQLHRLILAQNLELFSKINKLPTFSEIL